MQYIQNQQSAQIGEEGKNILIAYLLWWFVGLLGIHRFYLERPKTGLAQLLLLALGWLPLFIGWIVLGFWWLLDAYFVYQYVQDHNRANGTAPISINLTTRKSGDDNLDYLERLHDLREKGVISEDEYQQRRTKIM